MLLQPHLAISGCTHRCRAKSLIYGFQCCLHIGHKGLHKSIRIKRDDGTVGRYLWFARLIEVWKPEKAGKQL